MRGGALVGCVDGKVFDVSATCEVMCEPDDFGRTSRGLCGQPTTHFYPAMGGGTAALCAEHSEMFGCGGKGAWPTV